MLNGQKTDEEVMLETILPIPGCKVSAGPTLYYEPPSVKERVYKWGDRNYRTKISKPPYHCVLIGDYKEHELYTQCKTTVERDESYRLNQTIKRRAIKAFLAANL